MPISGMGESITVLSSSAMSIDLLPFMVPNAQVRDQTSRQAEGNHIPLAGVQTRLPM